MNLKSLSMLCPMLVLRVHLIGQYTDISFLRVEPIWLTLQSGRDGWEKVEAAIDAAFQSCSKVMIESLGIGEGFREFHASLVGKCSLKMIRVYGDLNTCFERSKCCCQ